MDKKSIKIFAMFVVTFIAIQTLSIVTAEASVYETGTGIQREIICDNGELETGTTSNSTIAVQMPTIHYEIDTDFVFTITSQYWTYDCQINLTIGNITKSVYMPDAFTGYQGWANFTASELPAGNNIPVNVTLYLTDWTYNGSWDGEMDILTVANYGIRVTLVEVMISALTIAVVVILFSKIAKSLNLKRKDE